MEQREKKPYEKPKVTKVRLDPQCAVLGFCKNSGSRGPGGTGCRSGITLCKAAGS